MFTSRHYLRRNTRLAFFRKYMYGINTKIDARMSKFRIA